MREADYDRPETWRAALVGVSRVLLISSSEVGIRLDQHQAVIDAARKAGAKLLVYTSILNADSSNLLLSQEHKETEAYIRASGIPFTLLRNGWYTENHTGSLAAAIEHGAILGAAKEGQFAAATRTDYAAAAAAVLTGRGHENKVYELGGGEPYTLAELRAGLAEAIADADAGASRGELNTRSHDLSRLIGRPTTPLKQAVAAALAHG